MKHSPVWVSACAFALLLGGSRFAFAQTGTSPSLSAVSTDVPRTLSYQGLLRSSAGTPVNDTEAITVRLYADSAGKQLLWQDVFTVNVQNGVFNILLGSQKPLPPAAQLGGALWLATQIGNDAELKPYSELAAAPYALTVPDSSITASKMGTDFVGSISLNGHKVTLRGGDLNLVTSGGLQGNYDPTTNSLYLIAPNAAADTNGKGANPLDYWDSHWSTYPCTHVGDICYNNSNDNPSRLACNTSSTKKFVCETGTGSNGQAPSWCGITKDDIPNLDSCNGKVHECQGGTGISTYTKGDILYASSTNALSTLSIGSTGQILTVVNGVPEWVTDTDADTDNFVSSINISGGSTGLTVSGGPITSTGTLTLGGTLSIADGGTGASTASGAITNLLPTQTGNSGDVLETNGSGTLSWVSPESGPQGRAGPTGPQGPAGPTGPQGPAGATGPQGPQGPAGADGAQGLTGATGPQGPQGPAGADGAQGQTGATGPQGPQGPAGADGAQGPQGLTGATGPQGPAGADGAQGPQGQTGATGPQGPQGPAGADGAQGPQGQTGATGAQGPAGPSIPSTNNTQNLGSPSYQWANLYIGDSIYPNLPAGIVVSNGPGYALSTAVSGVDYQAPLTFLNGLTENSDTVMWGGTLIHNTNIALSGYNTTFSGTGRIGIGTTSPTQELDVNGDVRIENLPTGTSDSIVVADGYGNLAERSTSALFLSSAWLLEGNTGTSPDTNFLGTIDSQDLVFRSYDTERVRILATGNVGIKTSTPAAALEIAGSFLASGTDGTTPVSGAGSRLMWVPAKSAIRAGYVDDGEWDDANIGNRSAAFGYNTTASGDYSTAMGVGTIASASNATAMGNNTTASGQSATSLGDNTYAEGNYSTAMGSNTDATGVASAAMGYNTFAGGDYSTAMGTNTSASGSGATAFGSNSSASGQNSYAVGENSDAEGEASTAMGGGTVAMGDYSTALGQYTSAGGINSFAVGFQSEAGGEDASALGEYASATGIASAAIGYYTLAAGAYSIALGASTNANGSYSTAMGESTDAIGDYSTAMGQATVAQGAYSTAMGSTSKANGSYSTAMGKGTIASGEYSTAMGDSSVAGGTYSFAAGDSSIANGFNSIALGSHALTGLFTSTFAYSDGSAPTENDAPHQFMARASGGYKFFDNASSTPDLTLASGTLSINGNIGIGTSSPGRPLDVNGRARIESLPTGTDDNLVTSNSAGDLSVRSLATALGSVTAPLLTASNGLTRSSNAFELGGSLSGATDIALSGNNLTFSGTGKVGVGTSSPAYPLDVNGTVRMAGHIIATSNASASSANGGVTVTDVPVFIISAGSTTGNFALTLPNSAATGDMIVVINHDPSYAATYGSIASVAPLGSRTFYYDGTNWQ